MKEFVFVLILSSLLNVYDCKTSFVKDQSIDFVFPPVQQHVIAGIPEGHLRPLGWQKKPEGKVREEKDAVTPPTFHMRYVKNSRPVVLRGLLKHAPVAEKWEEDSYLKEKYGKLNVTITVKKEVFNKESQRNKRRMLFKKFLLDYMYENWYLSSTVHEDMMAELPLPNVLSCGSYKERLTEAELWMSSGGTSSLLHSHGDNNVHCVLDGRKDFILIDPKHKEVFKFQETYPNSGSGHSPMDMEMINVFKYPKISQTPWIWSTLLHGDCIYVPAGYLHQVRSYGRGISFTVQFAPVPEFESAGCKEESKSKRRKKGKKDKEDVEQKGEKEEKEDVTEEEKLSLADVEFVWAYSNGERHLKQKKLVSSSLRRILSILLRDGNQLYQNQFKEFYEDALPADDNRPPADEIFHIMTPNDNRKYLSRDEINALAESRLQNVCDVFNKRYERVRDEL
ncbi:uncharacterized protein LOC123539702 [Mercenaria mercenaria]|uniref:uncharacterized protein LOC123539702 n=1 Tax=Mercenaria mercenaria TaxID=6596 RepID=UPI00234EF64F|nr:uncharacterized protein LOC123539702 [Mercenaria mercenaria]